MSRRAVWLQIGLYSNVVTYFFRYRCVALSTMTPSFIDNAYKWFNMTWFGSGNNVGSHCKIHGKCHRCSHKTLWNELKWSYRYWCVFVQNDLQQVRRQHRWPWSPWLVDRNILAVFLLCTVDDIFAIFGQRLKHFKVGLSNRHQVIFGSDFVVDVFLRRKFNFKKYIFSWFMVDRKLFETPTNFGSWRHSPSTQNLYWWSPSGRSIIVTKSPWLLTIGSVFHSENVPLM